MADSDSSPRRRSRSPTPSRSNSPPIRRERSPVGRDVGDAPARPEPVDGGAVADGARGRHVAPGDRGASAGSDGPAAKHWFVTTWAALHFPGTFTEGDIYPAVGASLVADGSRATYFVGQEERCPDSNQLHGHFVISLDRASKRGTVAKLFHEAYENVEARGVAPSDVRPLGRVGLATWKRWLIASHFEPVRSLKASIEYCTKEESRVRGPFEYGTRPADKVYLRINFSDGVRLRIHDGDGRTRMPVTDSIIVIRGGQVGVPEYMYLADSVPDA